MAQLKTSIHNYGGTSNNAGSMGTVNLDPYTYNPRYPGFDEANYRKLESKIDALGLTGYEREKAMDEAYQQILPIVQNEIKNSDRREYINQANYEVSQIQDPQARKEAQGKLTVTQLSQQLKEKYNLDPSAPDEEVFNSWINSMPDGGQLLADYMNDGNRELLYQGGLEQKIEAPETPESTVGGIQEIINQQSELSNDTMAGKTSNILNKLNLIGWATEGLDKLAQKIPTLTYEKQVENLANKMNNLSEDEIQNLYNRYVNMVRRGSDEKWQDDDRNNWALFRDAAFGDSDAAARLNTLYLNDYSQVVEGGGVERNQRGSQLWDKVGNGATVEDVNAAIDAKDAPGISKALAKGTVWTADKMKNLLNFIGGSYGGLQNYAEALGAGSQTLKDIKQGRTYVPQNLENDSEAFNAFVADQTANFGEYITDAPDTLLGKPVDPNVIKFFSNIPQSFLKMLTAKVRAKTNPLDTKVGLAKMMFTEEGQQALINRYGSPEALANTMNTDPAGLASDMIDMADKFNLVLNKTTGGAVQRQSFGDVTDALSDDFVKGLGASLNYTSEWLNNKGNQKTAGLVDIATDAALNPNKLSEDIAKETGMIARDIADMPADIQARARKRADQKLQNLNRMTKKEQEKFEELSNGVSVGEYFNQRGIKTVDEAGDHLIKNLDQVDTAMESIQGRWRSEELDDVLSEVVGYARRTKDKDNLGWIEDLERQNAQGGLEMKDINRVKRYFESHNHFDYLKAKNMEAARTATNMDSALRKWQQGIAEEAGLDNLKELNKETQLTKYVIDNATKREKGIKGNNDISLTDWIVASGGGLDASGIAALVGKKVYQSKRFQNKMVDVYNYIGKRELIDLPTVDMEKIQQSNINRAILAQELANVQTEQQFNQWLQKAQAMAGPALPYNPAYDGEPTTTIRVTPEGQSIRQGQIAEVESEAPSNYARGDTNALTEAERTLELYREQNDAIDEMYGRPKGTTNKKAEETIAKNKKSIADREATLELSRESNDALDEMYGRPKGTTNKKAEESIARDRKKMGLETIQEEPVNNTKLTAEDLRARREERGTPGGIIRGRDKGIDEDLTYELGTTDQPNQVGYINYEGDRLNKGSDQDVLNTAYAGNRSFNSAMEVQDGINGMLSDTGMIKVKYDNGYVDIDMMYAPVEDQLNSLLRFAYEDVKGVTLNIMDPATRSTARIADFDNIVDAVDYVDKYYAGTEINGEVVSGETGIPASTYKGKQIGGFDNRVDNLDEIPGMTTDERNIVQSISERASQGTPILEAIQEEIDSYQKRIDTENEEIKKLDKQIAKLQKSTEDKDIDKQNRLEDRRDQRKASVNRWNQLKKIAQKINAKDFGITGIDNYRSDREKTANEQLAYLEQRYGTDSSQRPDILD